MGVKFNREYEDISHELSEAIRTIEDCYEFVGMERSDWLELAQADRDECVRTLSDDIFYALGTDPSISVGSGIIEYDRSKHLIKVTVPPKLSHLIMLI